MTAVSCGIDWAQDHHDIAVVGEQGAVVCTERISNDVAGLARLLGVLTEHDPADARLEVAIETSRDLLVAGVRAAGEPAAVEQAMGVQLRGLVCQLDAVCTTLDWLQTQIATAFHSTPTPALRSSAVSLAWALRWEPGWPPRSGTATTGSPMPER